MHRYFGKHAADDKKKLWKPKGSCANKGKPRDDSPDDSPSAVVQGCSNTTEAEKEQNTTELQLPTSAKLEGDARDDPMLEES